MDIQWHGPEGLGDQFAVTETGRYGRGSNARILVRLIELLRISGE